MARFSFKTSIVNLLHLLFVLFLGKEDGGAISPASCSFKARKKGKIPKFTETKFITSNQKDYCSLPVIGKHSS